MTIREISNTRNSNDRNNLRSDGQGSGVLQDQGRGREDVLCTQGSVCGPVADEDGRKGDVQPETIPSSDGCGSDPLAVLNSLPGEQVEQLVGATPIRHVPRVVEITPVLDAEPKSGHNPSTQSEAKAKLTTEGRTGIANIPTGTKLVVGSPAYQMPEIKSEAEIWAADYVKKYAESQWVMDLLVRGYDAGHSAGQTTKVGYVVGYTSLSHRLPDFTRAAFDGLKDAEQFAQEQNDRFKMLKHKVYELHECEVSK